MNTILASVRPHRQSNLLAGVILLAIGLILIQLVARFAVKDATTLLWLNGILFSVELGIAAGALFFAARSSQVHSRRMALGWGLLGVGMFLYMLQDISAAWLKIAYANPPFPSIADGFHMASHEFLIVGILLLPAVPIARRERDQAAARLGRDNHRRGFVLLEFHYRESDDYNRPDQQRRDCRSSAASSRNIVCTDCGGVSAARRLERMTYVLLVLGTFTLVVAQIFGSLQALSSIPIVTIGVQLGLGIWKMLYAIAAVVHGLTVQTSAQANPLPLDSTANMAPVSSQ